MKRLTPRVLLTGLCVVWSITTIFSGFITGIAGLYVVRLILGACEAGLFPTLNLYLTMVYKREEQAKRVPYLWDEVKIALKDPKLYISELIQLCQDILLYGFSTFLPSIIVSMGFTSIEAQYLSIPVYIFGGIAFLCFAFVSDRLYLRGPLVLLANIPGILGYILIICPTPNDVKFFDTFLCAVAVYNGPGLNLTWLNVNIAPHYRRTTAIGMQQSIGNTAGIVAGQIYRTSPYLLGDAFSVGALGVSQLLIIAKWLYIRRCNEMKRKIASGEMEDTRKVKTGDWELDFRYHL
ncbi:hypothetical protein Brms1b_013356 [Colletotrichum noveboracense]|nr:hypothetical protein Brms1b_013356 [Colletotrichum noveboracense]